MKYLYKIFFYCLCSNISFAIGDNRFACESSTSFSQNPNPVSIGSTPNILKKRKIDEIGTDQEADAKRQNQHETSLEMLYHDLPIEIKLITNQKIVENIKKSICDQTLTNGDVFGLIGALYSETHEILEVLLKKNTLENANVNNIRKMMSIVEAVVLSNNQSDAVFSQALNCMDINEFLGSIKSLVHPQEGFAEGRKERILLWVKKFGWYLRHLCADDPSCDYDSDDPIHFVDVKKIDTLIMEMILVFNNSFYGSLENQFADHKNSLQAYLEKNLKRFTFTYEELMDHENPYVRLALFARISSSSREFEEEKLLSLIEQKRLNGIEMDSISGRFCITTDFIDGFAQSIVFFVISDTTNISNFAPALSKAYSLEKIAFESTPQNVMFILVGTFAPMLSLKSIDFSGALLKDKDLNALLNVFHLKFHCPGTVIWHNNDFYKNRCNIEEINLAGNQITNGGVKKISKILQSNNTLKSINLVGNKFDKIGAHYLIEALKINKTLKKMNIRDVRIDSKGLLSLAEILETNQSLEEFDVGLMEMNQESAARLAAALTQNNGLKTLRLWGETTSDGLLCFAQMLKTNQNLEEFSLGIDEMNQETATALADALKQNRTLKTLALYGIPSILSEEAITCLAEGLRKNTSLNVLMLKFFIISEGGADILEELVQKKTSFEVHYR